MPKPPLELMLHDLVQLRKSHPCGGDQWRIVRLGAEVGLRCATCGRKIFLPRSELERRIKRLIERGSDPSVGQ